VILHVLLASALSASAGHPADSVRTAPKQAGVARPDSVVFTLPAPTIKAPSQPEPRIAGLVTLAWPSKKQAAVDAVPARNEPVPATQIASTVVPTVVASVSTRPVEVVQQAAPVVKPTPSTLTTTAPADASAVALPVRSSVPAAAPAAAITTSDGRLVLGTRSTVTVERLHAVPLPAAGLRLAPPSLADSIVVYKREHTLTLFLRGVPVRSYFVALGSRPVGDKISAGDDRTPEGLFSINAHNPASKYHLALRISYPDAAHRERAAKLGVDPGGDIMIHGLPIKFSNAGKDHRLDDWTNGCVALTNEEIEEIWRAVPDGTPIQIKP
jgi:hypothetical protein